MTKLRDALSDDFGINTVEGNTDIEFEGNITGVQDINIEGDCTFEKSVTHLGSVFKGLTVVSSATYTLQETDTLLHVTYTSTGEVTITLPTAQAVSGRMLQIKDAGLSAQVYHINIVTEGAELIDGNTSIIVNDAGCTKTLYSDGSNWFILGSTQTSARLAGYLPTPADTTITVADTFYPFTGAITHNPLIGFSKNAGVLTYDYATTKTFVFTWAVSMRSNAGLSTAHLGISHNGEVLDYTSVSIMGRYFKTAGEAGSVSGLYAIELNQGDTIQFQLTSDGAGDVLTVVHMNVAARSLSD